MPHGALAWIEIPAKDVEASAEFYRGVFGWTIKHDDEWPDYPMFEDASGHMRGGFTTAWQPHDRAGYVPYVTVDSIETTLKAVEEHGGRVAREKILVSESVGWHARFEDPAGNLVGLYEGSHEPTESLP